MANFQFNEELHEYRLDGKRIPSVSEILREGKLLPEIFLRYNPARRIPVLKGKYIHLATEWYDKNILDEESIKGVIKPYFEAWKRFRAESGFTATHIELQLYHPRLLYAGTIDRVGYFQSQPDIEVLLDIKTGESRVISTTIQLAAYAELLTVNKLGLPNKIVALYLKSTGRYEMVEYGLENITEAYLVFMDALSVYQYREKHNLLGKGNSFPVEGGTQNE